VEKIRQKNIINEKQIEMVEEKIDILEKKADKSNIYQADIPLKGGPRQGILSHTFTHSHASSHILPSRPLGETGPILIAPH